MEEKKAEVVNQTEKRRRFSSVTRITKSSGTHVESPGSVVLNGGRRTSSLWNIFRKSGGTKVVLLENRIPLLALYKVTHNIIVAST